MQVNPLAALMTHLFYLIDMKYLFSELIQIPMFFPLLTIKLRPCFLNKR